MLREDSPLGAGQQLPADAPVGQAEELAKVKEGGAHALEARVDVDDQGAWRLVTLLVIIDIVIRSFADPATEDLFNGLSSRRARQACPAAIWPIVRRKLTQLNRVRDVWELSVPPGNRLERLKGDRAGQHSIRINDQYRVCFRWEDGYADEVEVTDYH